MVQPKILYCFDIDNTLVNSSNSTLKGVRSALSEGFNENLREVEVSKHAATAMAVAKEYLCGNNITRENTEHYDEKIKKSKEAYLRIVTEGIKDGSFYWKPLPNVINLLEKLSMHDDVRLALLSANPRKIAEKKLKNAGIDVQMFMEGSELLGAFGCEDEVRSELVKTLWTRYCNISGFKEERPNPHFMVIIGDTPNDISCAHDNGLPCVAVATGEYTVKELQTANADVVLDSFEDLNRSDDISRRMKTLLSV